jgi:hypothetical protein
MISPLEILALAIAFALSGAIAWAGWRWLPECRRGVVSLLAVAVAYAAGYLLLAYEDAIPPVRHFHWPPYLALGAAVVARFASAPRCPTAVRWLLYSLAALACAYFLTPTWPALWPPRPICIALLAGYILAVTLAIEPLLRRLDAMTMLAAMTVSLGALAILILAAVSLVYGIFALVAAAAFAGFSAVAWRKADQASLAGLALLYAVLACGWAFIACIEPRPALPGLLIAPLAPAALWIAEFGPPARLDKYRRTACQAALLVVVLASAALLVLI